MPAAKLFEQLMQLPAAVRQYLLITFNYWSFTLTDGALRMLVVLHFHDLGYTPFAIAMLFLFYEIFGVVTNLLGGYLGARLGLNRTMNLGLGMQVFALAMLLVPAASLPLWLAGVPWVMAAQALSGVAKDLNKMSAKSAIKLLVPKGEQGKLYKWVALLTGSKNALKGAGFFLGGVLLALLGFELAIATMASMLGLVWLLSLVMLKKDLGKAKNKPKFTEIFSKSRSVNILSAARLFLFAARDVWFVVALPVYLASKFGWDHWAVGGFLAVWVIGYGIVQTLAPKITGNHQHQSLAVGAVPDGRSALIWASILAFIPALIASAIQFSFYPEASLLLGLMLFGALFAVNSSLHSYLIVSYASEEAVSLDVGFYYMANAMGRLVGTVLSGWVYQSHGLVACLWMSTAFIATTALISIKLPRQSKE
ncbi:organoarsenical effux MFS transporter ArsJ [Shewanella xiamenensis]|uniref:organoarsenical effux MFS transporter ArsJ n=1 Tax=Shewanella xiamenensis TaxID=332186 RepID=UPI0024A698C6|nr:organoarsenical effux MFS transporter ArsJ [Shewanella xiamenensis]MDI5834938.1 organoarsenical effux MFS transporter ArsJ [Shewanella xiamenensis]MDI5838878.1 organoarsenical effux MFS transporter ArsJ [Shewanella xiamenensis]MDI5845427.1 organoarsenical effux MFS transporter ArsJ [Shewanella xiamenensis]MDI5849220.1 organoarsenical effux MFS transporter ArsJ [Shewanella xiamenensis]MDI5850788.1 organoarsenical effux MFS transporter ArsJ [Shewanella xiamenensis]